MHHIFAAADGTGFWESKMAATIVGALAGIAGVFIGKHLERTRDKHKELIDYDHALQFVALELEFYRGKFGTLRQYLQAMRDALREHRFSYAIPSFTFYPATLEHAKITLSSYLQNPELVGRVGECHFELSHIVERLVQAKEEAASMCESAATHGADSVVTLEPIDNLEGFLLLLDQNISRFQSVREAVNDERGKCQEKLEKLHNTFIGSFLAD